jgi:hypothetical protein
VKKNSLNKFKKIIRLVEITQHIDDPKTKIELYKAKLILKDGSVLYIAEIYKDASLLKYSYYWLTSANKLIIGWDRAPHHTHLKTFPHHKHLAGKKKPIESEERNLADVLAFITEHIK